MNALRLNDYGVSEINQNEMLEIDGGFLPLIIVGVALLVAGCNTTAPSSIGGAMPMKSDTTSRDSTGHK